MGQDKRKSGKKGENRVFGQYSSGALIGGVKNVLQGTLFYFTAINFVMLVWLSIKDTSFSDAFRDFITKYMPWLNFPVFIAISVVILGVLMWVEYKYVIPSHYEFFNWQFYKHNNPMRTDLREVIDRLGAIEKKLGIKKSGKGRHS